MKPTNDGPVEPFGGLTGLTALAAMHRLMFSMNSLAISDLGRELGVMLVEAGRCSLTDGCKVRDGGFSLEGGSHARPTRSLVQGGCGDDRSGPAGGGRGRAQDPALRLPKGAAPAKDAPPKDKDKGKDNAKAPKKGGCSRVPPGRLTRGFARPLTRWPTRLDVDGVVARARSTAPAGRDLSLSGFKIAIAGSEALSAAYYPS